MKKLFIVFLSLVFIIILIIFAVRDRLSIDSILSNIEKQTGLEIELKDKNKWIFYPSIIFNNSNVSIEQKDSSLKIKKARININKRYWPTSPFYINLNTDIANYEGIEIHDLVIYAKYSNSIINVENLTGKIIEGNLQLTVKLNLDETQFFDLQGKYTNISLNTLLKKSKVADWERVRIKLSSPSFNLSGSIKGEKQILSSLKGTIPVTGTFYLVSTEEDRFAAALLSLLVDKIPNLSPISQSVDFILSRYANIPSSIRGTLIIKDGLIESDEILVTNKGSKLTVKGSYNFLKDIIDGNIYFFDNNEIFLEASLKGKIGNPKILLGGKVFSENEDETQQDLKQLFEQGLNSLLNKLLKTDE